MHDTYKKNQARFFRDYGGKEFSARMVVHGVTENPIYRGTYMLDLGDGWLNGDIECRFSDKETIDKITDLNKGDQVLIDGIVKDHVFGSILLENCTISTN
jgi:hypothetical protein